jgi:hypothetical protein
MADIEKRLETIDGKLTKALHELKELKELVEGQGCDALAADQVSGTSRKLDEILEWIHSQ